MIGQIYMCKYVKSCFTHVGILWASSCIYLHFSKTSFIE